MAPATPCCKRRPSSAGQTGTVVLLSGDVPLLTRRALEDLVRTHTEAGAAATVLTAVVDRPYGYGRIVRTQGKINRIVEERDASPAQRNIHEINSGIYAFDVEPLFDSLEKIGADNAQNEYYLPDLVAIYRRRRRVVTTCTIPDAVEIRGINSRTELAEVSAMVRQQKNEELMAAGVTLIDPATTYIDTGVAIGRDTVVHPCVFIEGGTTIGSACEIHAGSRIVNSTIGDRVVVRNHSVISDSSVGDRRADRPVRAPAARGTRRRERAHRQLRRAEEGDAGRRQQGEPSRVHRRCDHRRQGQHRRRHDHVQL